ncbi:DUF808 domain-containing protein [Luteococcus sp. H138]|uniref:DUF808 domain-containing protein n=1 Tax=unclassified Luteococcus TaxID=2639923 RepID=UPI00313B46D9
MAGGLAALLDDVAAIAKVAAASIDDVGAAAGKASIKATGVVVDDTAVTPQYVAGVTPDRELPIIKKIALGSIRNKLLFILPVVILLSIYAKWALTPILMLGGAYLSYEGAHKIWGKLTGHGHGEGTGGDPETPVVLEGPEQEAKMIKGAITTDFILSAEIMVIALNEVTDQPLMTRIGSLIAVALLITFLVYGVVAIIVKLDDIGLKMTQKGLKSGAIVVKAMPVILSILSTVGLAAMLWVGGHLLMVGADELGLHAPYEFVHHLEHIVTHAVPHALSATLGWFTNTLGSAVIGFIVGSIIVGILAVLPFGHGKGHGDSHAETAHEGGSHAVEAPAEPQAAGEWPGEGTRDADVEENAVPESEDATSADTEPRA